MLKFTLK